MSERKSARSRKSICYATLGDDSGSDDDFASSPSLKKQKTANKKEDKPKKERKKDGSQLQSSCSSSVSKSIASVPSSILKRRSNFDDELQRALEMSILETSASQSLDDTNTVATSKSRSNTHDGDSQPNDHVVTEVKVDIEPLPPAPPRLENIGIEENDDMPELAPAPSSLHHHEQTGRVLPPVDDLSPNPPKLVPVTAVASSVCAALVDDTIELVKSPDGISGGNGRLRRGAAQKSKKETNTMTTTTTTTTASKRKTVSAKKRVIDDDDDDDDLDKNSEAGSDFVPDNGCNSDNDDDDNDEEEEEEDDFSPSDDDDSDFDDGKKKAKKKPAVKNGKKICPVEQKSSSTKVQKPTTKSTTTAGRGHKSSIQENAVTQSMSKNPSKQSTTRKAPSLGGSLAMPSTKPSSSSAAISSSSKSSSSSSISTTTTLSSPVLPHPSSISHKSSKSTTPSPNTPTLSQGLVSRQWKPPGQSTNNNPSNLKSPSSGLRLGLSRNQRGVKPLHDSVKVS